MGRNWHQSPASGTCSGLEASCQEEARRVGSQAWWLSTASQMQPVRPLRDEEQSCEAGGGGVCSQAGWPFFMAGLVGQEGLGRFGRSPSAQTKRKTGRPGQAGGLLPHF